MHVQFRLDIVHWLFTYHSIVLLLLSNKLIFKLVTPCLKPKKKNLSTGMDTLTVAKNKKKKQNINFN